MKKEHQAMMRTSGATGEYYLMTIPEYWDRFCSDIQEKRDWEETLAADGARMVCTTLKRYDVFMDRLRPYLKSPISETSYFELQDAVQAIRYKKNGKEYATSTMNGVWSLLGDIYKYAQDYGDAYNILKFVPQDAVRRGKFATKEALVRELKEEMKRKGQIVKSLTMAQQKKLAKKLAENIEGDGRYCALAIMFYAGLRPSECCALTFGDLVPFRDHPQRSLLRLHKSSTKTGAVKDGGKTTNSYRKIAVHCELMELLSQRAGYVSAQVEGSIDQLPICCYENQFDRSCRYYQLSQMAAELFKCLQMSDDEWLPFTLAMYTDENIAAEEAASQHLTLYVLRRNFWTWMASSTQLDDFEKRYFMGHRMHLGWEDCRRNYNNEDLLWAMVQKLDNYMVHEGLHRKKMITELTDGCQFHLSNCGVAKLHIPKSALLRGGKLSLQLDALEVSDPIVLEMLTRIGRSYRSLPVNARVTGMPECEVKLPSINRQYSNYCALHLPPKSRKADDSGEQTEPKDGGEVSEEGAQTREPHAESSACG
ncbi:MAG: hypothetical protein RSE33_20950 [Hafnia sp.]